MWYVCVHLVVGGWVGGGRVASSFTHCGGPLPPPRPPPPFEQAVDLLKYYLGQNVTLNTSTVLPPSVTPDSPLYALALLPGSPVVAVSSALDVSESAV